MHVRGHVGTLVPMQLKETELLEALLFYRKPAQVCSDWKVWTSGSVFELLLYV